VNISAQTSRKKIHKVPIVRLHKLPLWGAQTSHSRDTNRTSSLFGLFLGLLEESVEASLLRCRAASSPTYPLKVHGRGFPPSKPSPVTYALDGEAIGRYQENVLVPRFFLTFSFLDVPYISRSCARHFSPGPGPVRELRCFLTFPCLDVP
jgi:hypothetical protein